MLTSNYDFITVILTHNILTLLKNKFTNLFKNKYKGYTSYSIYTATNNPVGIL